VILIFLLFILASPFHLGVGCQRLIVGFTD